MADAIPSRKRANPPQPKKSPFASRGVQLGIVLVVIIVAVVAVWAVYPRTPNPVAVFNTSEGTFRVELYKDKMPITVNNFVRLVNAGFYNGLIFHRINAGFMIQGGGYWPNGTQKMDPFGQIAFESSDVKHLNGTISMASTGAGIGGSAEFFICDGAQPSLDGKYAAFGRTIEGLDVVHTIAVQPHAIGSDGTGRPNTDIIINSIVIE